MEGQVFKYIYILWNTYQQQGIKKNFYSLFFLAYFDPETPN